MQRQTIIRTLTRFLVLLGILVLLYLAPLEQLDDLGVIFLAAVMAIPVAAYRLEYRLFARRAVIGQGCVEAGWARKHLWRGTVMKAWAYLAAYGLALLILVAVSSLGRGEWTIVFAAALLLGLVEALTLGFASREARGDFLPVFHRGVVKWPVLLLVITASAILVFNTPYPVYIDQDVVFLAERSFDEQVNRFASPLLGYTHAVLSTADTVSLFFAQNYIPAVENRAVKWVLWIYFALKAAISTGLLVYLLLGALTLLSVKERKGWRVLGRSVFEKAFTLTFIGLFALYLYAITIDVAAVDHNPPQVPANCDQALAALARANEARTRALSSEEQELVAGVNEEIAAGVGAAFSAAGAGVDRYLDWYFSVLGEYQRLGAAVAGRFNRQSPDKLGEFLVNEINAQLEALNLALDARILAAVNTSARNAGLQLPAGPAFGDCLPDLAFEPIVFAPTPAYVGQPQALLTGGAIAAITAKKLAAKVSAKGAAKVAGKYGASVATGLTAATLCGPLAPVCGVGAALATWLAVDAAIVTTDEMLNRDELRTEILAELEHQQGLIEKQLVARHQGVIGNRYDTIEATFRIPADGMQRR